MDEIENIESKSIFNKTQDEITVGDALKVNLTVMAVFAAIPVVYYGGAAAVESTRGWLRRKRFEMELKKFEAETQEVE